MPVAPVNPPCAFVTYDEKTIEADAQSKITPLAEKANKLKDVLASDDCTICLEDFKDKKIVYHSGEGIKHPFHPQCVKQWVLDNKSCPLCKCSVDLNDSKEALDLTSIELSRANNPIINHFRFDPQIIEEQQRREQFLQVQNHDIGQNERNEILDDFDL